MNELHRKSGTRNRLLLDRAKNRIEGFDQVQQSLEDLYAHCEDRRIGVIRKPLRRAFGCSIYQDDYPFIYINSLLSRPQQVITGFHEYFHVTDHVLGLGALWSAGSLWNVSKYEYQANVVGVTAWMPEPMMDGLTLDEIAREFAVTREVARFRLSLLQ